MLIQPEYFFLAFGVASAVMLMLLAVGRHRYGSALLVRAELPGDQSAARPEIAVHSVSTAQAVHMTRLADIVMVASATAEHAERFHHAAHQQIDAANYAIQNLLDELSSVMTVAGYDMPRRSGPARAQRSSGRARYETALAA